MDILLGRCLNAKDKDIGTYYISEAVTYIISIRDDISETELQTIAEQVSKEGGELIMTLAERLMEKGRQEAMTLAEKMMEKGIEKGLLAGKREMTKKLLRMGVSPKQIAEASELSLGEIEELKKEIGN